MGLLDWIIGWFLDYWIGLDYWIFHPNMDSVVVHSSQGRFSFFFAMLCCAVASQGSFRFLLITPLSQKRLYLINKSDLWNIFFEK